MGCVVNYVQWQNQLVMAYINNRDIALATKITGFFAPDSSLRHFMSEPADSQMQITASMPELINFGMFRLKAPANQPRF